ncbi:MAG: sugar isomerase [Verrucomicrobia bacterium]|nr:MAG: sugar isomerase [Verrucomicrobiota bacterium]
MKLENWISNYIVAHCQTHAALPVDRVASLRDRLDRALVDDRQIFVCGNGGSAANASHFVTDLGKGASDAIGRRFRCLSLNDNMPWMSAIGNDYAYDDIFVRQLENFARKGDLLMVMSVSGNSPNAVKAVKWAASNGLDTVALVGGQGGRLAEKAAFVIRIDDTHFGRVEDAHMLICHLLCYSYMDDSIPLE